RSWPCRSTPEDVCQGRRRGSKRGKDADPDGISPAELLSQDDVAVQDAMARCEAPGSKVVTDSDKRRNAAPCLPCTVSRTWPRTACRCHARMAGTRGVCAPYGREGRASNDATLKMWR